MFWKFICFTGNWKWNPKIANSKLRITQSNWLIVVRKNQILIKLTGIVRLNQQKHKRLWKWERIVEDGYFQFEIRYKNNECFCSQWLQKHWISPILGQLIKVNVEKM